MLNINTITKNKLRLLIPVHLLIAPFFYIGFILVSFSDKKIVSY